MSTTVWEGKAGHCFVDVEIDFVSSGYHIDGISNGNHESSTEDEGEDIRIINEVNIEGLKIPQEELGLMQLCCPTVWAAIWEIINETEL